MNELILQSYIKKLKKEHIKEYAKNNDIILQNNEVDIIYEYLTKYFKIFYNGDPTNLFFELKNKLSPNTYNKLVKLYKEAKEKIKN